MPAARRRLCLMLAAFAALLAGAALLGLLVNPFGEWPTGLVDRRYRSGATSSCMVDQRERVTMPYRVRSDQPRVLLLGSSRVQCGMAIPFDAGDGFLNAGLRGATVPEHVDLLGVAVDNPNLQRVLIGLDFFAFSAAYPDYLDHDMPARIHHPFASAIPDLLGELRRGLLTVDSVVESVRTLGRLARGMPKLASRHESPWQEQEIQSAMAVSEGLQRFDEARIRAGLASIAGMYLGYRASTEHVNGLRTAVETLRARGVEVTPVVLAMSACELAMLRRLGLWSAFEAWKRTLPAIVGGYWDFSVSPTAMHQAQVFTDTVHLRPAAGQAILRRVMGLDCAGCGEAASGLAIDGVWVDADTIDAHLAHTARGLDFLSFEPCGRVVAALPPA